MRLAPCRHVDAVAVTTGIDPAAARCRPIVFQGREPFDGFAIRDRVAIDFVEHGFGARLIQAALHRILPGHVANGAVPRLIVVVLIEFLDPLPQLEYEVEIATAIAFRFNGLMVPL